MSVNCRHKECRDAFECTLVDEMNFSKVLAYFAANEALETVSLPNAIHQYEYAVRKGIVFA